MTKKGSFDVALLDKDFVPPQTVRDFDINMRIGANIVKPRIITGEVVVISALCMFLAMLLLS